MWGAVPCEKIEESVSYVTWNGPYTIMFYYPYSTVYTSDNAFEFGTMYNKCEI